MRAPDPEKWKAKPWEVSEVALQSDSEFGDNDESGIEELAETVARRRALEELRALAYQPEMLTRQSLCNRIAEIEAEGE